MTDAAVTSPATQRTPTLGGVAVTDLSAGIGAVLWLVAAVTGALNGVVSLALTLAPLVLVPLGSGMAATPSFTGRTHRLHRAAVVAQPVGATLVLVSLSVDPGSTVARLAALPWVVVTGTLALGGFNRTLDRGVWPLSETVVDAGLAYAVVGAVALVFYQFGLTFRFGSAIILLTAVHFHYAGFVLPVLAGLAVRAAGDGAERKKTEAGTAGAGVRMLLGVVLVGPALIAVGITFSPLVEVLAVGGFTVAVAAFGGFIAVHVAPTRPRVQSVFVAVSALVLPLSMLLALGYGVATFTGYDPLGLDIGTMVTLHGTLNAFGFALLGTVGWRLAVPEAADRP